MVNICFSSVSQHACIYFSMVYPGAAIYQMHINSPFAALSFLISYSTSMIVSYYPCFTGGLFIERAEQLTLLFSESVCLRPAGLYTKCQSNSSQNHSIQEESDLGCVYKHIPTSMDTHPVTAMGLPRDTEMLKLAQLTYILYNSVRTCCVLVTHSWWRQMRFPFIF